MRLLALWLLLSSPLAFASSPIETSTQHYLHISEGPLSGSLQHLSRVFGVSILSSSELLEQVTAPDLEGMFDLRQAVARLLKGTHLRASYSESGLVVKAASSEGHTPAHTDVAAESSEDSIQISGYRDTLALAYQARFDSVTPKEFMFSDEISKLPEHSVAEVLQRMPGVAITRDAGEGRQVSIRGLDSSFTRIQINGMESLATTASIDARGAINNSRRFDLNLIPAQLLTQIELYKSNPASLDGGLSGTINLSTRRPFDFTEPQRQILVEYRYNEFGQTEGTGLSALLTQASQEQQVGALLAFTYEARQAVEKGFSTIRWAQGDWGDLALPERTGDTLEPEVYQLLQRGQLFHPRYNRYDLYSRNLQRFAVNLSMQWQPNDKLLLSLDGINGFMKVDMDEYHISSLGLSFNDLHTVEIVEGVIAGNDLIYASLNQVDLRTEYNRQSYQTDFYQYLVSANYAVNTENELIITLGSQGSHFDNPLHERVYLWSPSQWFSYDYRQHKRLSVNRYGIDITNADNWSLYRTNKDADKVDNQFFKAQLQFINEISSEWSCEHGIQFKIYNNQQRSWESSNSQQRGLESSSFSRLMPKSFNHGMDIKGLPTTWVVATTGAYQALHTPLNLFKEAPNHHTQLTEHSLGLFSQWHWDTTLFGRPWQGHLGLRREELTLESRANDSISAENTHIQWLPSLNGMLHLNREWRLRMSADRSWGRAEAHQLSPYVNVQAGSQEISRGNPKLEPVTSNTINLALEWFPKPLEHLSVGWFYKLIDNLIYDSSTTLPYGDTGLALSLIQAKGQDAKTLYTVQQPMNGDRVRLQGVELVALSSILPTVFNQKLGINFNYTYTDANNLYRINENWQRKPLVGLSRHVANAVLFLDMEKLGARLAGSYRSRYLQSVPSGNGNDEEGVHNSLYLDFSAYWRLSKSLRFDFEISNLTNQAYDQYTDSSDRLYTYTLTGSEYKLELNYRF